MNYYGVLKIKLFYSCGFEWNRMNQYRDNAIHLHID